LIEAEGYEAYVDIISKTPYGFLFKGQDQLFIEHNYHEYTYKLYKMLFRRKPFSIACMISYLRLKEIEISNIISIIEGIRYNLSESEIGKFIVGMGI
jgi:V/A-type H+-transporting ATPase subunit C